MSAFLCAAVPHVVPLSFATCCMQITLDWLRQSRANELLMGFLVYGAFNFALKEASKSYCLRLCLVPR